MPLAYLLDLLAQRWSTSPQWIDEECSYAWRETGLAFLRLEGEVSAERSDRRPGSGAPIPKRGADSPPMRITRLKSPPQ